MRDVIELQNAPAILSSAAVCGKKEFDGPLGNAFDLHSDDDRFGEDTWEKAEGEMQHLALGLALSKARLRPDDLGAVFAGDLINQCTCSAQGLLSYDLPYFGLFGACSTIGEGLILASLLCGGEKPYLRRAAAVTSSHNCTAERQFRMPVEYGGQRPPTAQWTVTAAGAFVVGQKDHGPYVSRVLPGRTVDRGIRDAANMGAAMAPAAADTLFRFFSATGKRPEDYDLILSGDLGAEGHRILRELASAEGCDLSRNYNDCGLMIYSRASQDTHSGGSGCGCSASVLSVDILPRMRKGELKNVLFMPTGALMSPLSSGQGQSIPGIAHLIELTAERPGTAKTGTGMGKEGD